MQDTEGIQKVSYRLPNNMEGVLMMHNNVLKKWAELSAAQKEFSKMKNQRQALLVCRFFVIRRFGFFSVSRGETGGNGKTQQVSVGNREIGRGGMPGPFDIQIILKVT